MLIKIVLFLMVVVIVMLAVAIWDIIQRRRGLGNDQNFESLISRLKDAIGVTSSDALSKNSSEFLKLANEVLSKQTQAGEKNLTGKKELIDQVLQAMNERLEGVKTLVIDLEKNSGVKFGELASQLKSTADQTGKLQVTAGQLHSVLASTKMRGQWGERMAEDVLRLAGFVEGINYTKQKSLETGNTRPDFTFSLPQNLIVNMDVKFPLDNYWKYYESESETDKQSYKNQFLKDVKLRIKEVTTRDYINPEEHTVDYVIVFIPNEQVYAFINESDRTILDEALKSKVILCSPLTLYAILAVIRQAIDNFNLEKTAAKMLSLLGTFNKQYEMFMNSFDKMGQKIDDAQKEFNSLTSTRQNKLEKVLRQIEDLREQKGIPSDKPAEVENLFEEK